MGTSGRSFLFRSGAKISLLSQEMAPEGTHEIRVFLSPCVPYGAHKRILKPVLVHRSNLLNQPIPR